ncbi:surface polysaccharide O-acyltransferase-like enzyme [Clostridium algifaecis]|uniref:Surface polysaccharide O-acyltransferase-like enzyme n=1 Tax=Clostridium algifaecis TaxID=1472040 RepID=A0ABS4KQ78_9CLOT|nr:surface polysaccharide O-acyltransferase-like enzyme [Clostridium algifaecis]
MKNDKNISLKYLFKKRIPRVLIPFLVWNIIYIIAYCRVKGGHSIIREFIASIFSTRGYAEHLWYLYALIAIYLILPIVRCFISRTNKALINYALLIWTFFSIFMPFIHQFIPKVQFANYADLNILAGYLGYFILGYKLANSKRTFNTISLVILFIIGWMITAIGGYEYQNLLGNKNIFFQDFLTPNVVVMSITLFIFIKQLLQKHKLSAKIKPIILNLSYLSFGIYLVHFLFRNVGLIIFQKYPVNPYLYLIISPVFVFIMSYITICIASKIKVLSFCITGNKYKKIHN